MWLNKVTTKHFIFFLQTDIFELSSSLPRLTSENIKRNAGLIKGLTPIEMKLLNLKDSEVMAAIGKFSDYTPEQVMLNTVIIR